MPSRETTVGQSCVASTASTKSTKHQMTSGDTPPTSCWYLPATRFATYSRTRFFTNTLAQSEVNHPVMDYLEPQLKQFLPIEAPALSALFACSPVFLIKSIMLSPILILKTSAASGRR